MSSGEMRGSGSGGLRDPDPGKEAGSGESAGGRVTAGSSAAREAPNMLPGRARRRFRLERLMVRLVATCGVIGIDVALGAILAANKVQGWIIGLVVGAVSVILSAVLWSSRQL